MRNEKFKLSFSIRINKETPAHIYFSLFANMIPIGLEHELATRAKMGDCVCRVEEFQHILDRWKPDIISTLDT